MPNNVQKYITENCLYLSEEDILQMNESDNGPINIVLNGLNKHFYSVFQRRNHLFVKRLLTMKMPY